MHAYIILLSNVFPMLFENAKNLLHSAINSLEYWWFVPCRKFLSRYISVRNICPYFTNYIDLNGVQNENWLILSFWNTPLFISNVTYTTWEAGIA
jgi:hypothetical protein